MNILVLSAAYVAALIVANLALAKLGPWSSPYIAFLFIGLDLTLRDKIHDAANGKARIMLPLILVSGAISYAISPEAGRIAIASVVAFVCAMASDAFVYHRLRGRSWMIRVNGSNLVGAGVDSIIFPTIAFAAVLPWVTAADWAAKIAGGAAWAWMLKK